MCRCSNASACWVAPSRARGLKHVSLLQCLGLLGRALTGARIETCVVAPMSRLAGSRPHGRADCNFVEAAEGILPVRVAPSRARGLKQLVAPYIVVVGMVAPSRARGLKLRNDVDA